MRGLSRKLHYKYHQYMKSRRFVPEVKRDTFLVAFPRSGSTWISCIATELMFGTSPRNIQNVTSFVPDVHDLPVESRVPDAPSYLVKSHLPRREPLPAGEYRRVIYLIRDPRDALLSYHRYVTARYQYTGNLRNFVVDTLCGRTWPCSWQEHVNSWLGPRDDSAPLKLNFLRYEDFIEDPVSATTQLADLLDLNVSRGQIADAIAASSPAKMREKENYDPVFPRSPLRFIGPATAGSWKARAVGADVEIFDLIQEYAGPTMARFGYGTPVASIHHAAQLATLHAGDRL
ncbi:MAG TPA: sulfotransferase domain-containing protein [Stellaceae bacterium]|jgi:hypothetical protein|nr:sulfotransferase domain-containing protein [Stellaceae bacterium]